jgi:S1-C subfamily serine protease
MYPREPEPSESHRIEVHTAARGPSPLSRLLAVLLLLCAAALVWSVMTGQRARRDATPPPPDPRAITPRGDLAADEQSTIELFQRDSPSVVHVTNLALKRSALSLNVFEIPQGTGSGFIWDSEGHVVTNYHVIQKANAAEVTLSDGTTWKASLVGAEPDKDLAVLKIDAPRDKLPALAVGTSSDLQVGQKVFAIGNPFGFDQTLTTGVISGLDREIKSVSEHPIQGVIQTDAAINPGNSGGPLLDSAGRLIGVNTAIYSPSGAYAGIGFAVPVDTINRIVPQLITNGKVVRPGLGIHIIADRVAKQLHIAGVVVGDVPPDSAAAKAGLIGITANPSGSWVLGDVIVAVDGKSVREVDDLYRILDDKQVGDAVVLDVVKKGEKRQVQVSLQPLP